MKNKNTNVKFENNSLKYVDNTTKNPIYIFKHFNKNDLLNKEIKKVIVKNAEVKETIVYDRDFKEDLNNYENPIIPRKKKYNIYLDFDLNTYN